MAVDPAVQFPTPGLNVPYAYQPVETKLNPPIQLQAADYGQIGKTALAAAGQVFDTLRQSPLNPEVKAKMDLGTKLAREGISHIDWAQKQKGELGQWQVGIDASGNTYYIPPAQGTRTYQSWIAPNLEDGQDGKDKDGKPPLHPSNTGAGDGKQPAPPAPPAPPPITTGQYTPSPSGMFAAAAPPAPAPDSFQGPNQAQTTAAVQQALQRNQFASSEQGVPAGYNPPQPSGPMGAPQGSFLNPATGSIEPLQTQQPPMQQLPQPDQAALANWQAQNAHPVASSVDAVNWAKGYDTRTQDATYLPHGGPNATPAYAFHLKGGGTNIVPIAQMVKNGFGPSVAGQNTSAILSTSDRLTNQAPGMTLGATGQAPPGMELSQQQAGQAPAAPGQPYQPTDYRTAAEQGQPPGSYAAQPYQQAVAQAAASPENLTAQTTQAGQPAQPAQPQPPSRMPNPIAPADAPAAIADLDKTPDGPVDEGTGDTRKKKIGNLWYYRDNSDTPWKGRYYTALPGTSTWTQSRAYIGEEGYQEVTLPDTVINQELEKETGPTGPPELKTLTTQQIKGMPMEQKQAYLDYAKSWHGTGGQSNSETNNFIAASIDAIKQLEQAKDIVHVTPNPADYSDEAKKAYAAYKTNHSLINDPDPGLKGWVHHVQGRIQSVWSGGDFPPSDDMARTIGNLATDLRTPGLEPVNGTVTPATAGWHMNTQIPIGRAWMPLNIGKEGTPAQQNPMDVPAITNLTKGGTSKEAKIAGIQQLEDTIINNLHQRYHLALTDNERVDPDSSKSILNVMKASKTPDKPLSVPDNVYRDANGQRRNPYTMPQVFGPEDLQVLKNKYGSGKHYMGPDENGNMTEYVTQ